MGSNYQDSREARNAYHRKYYHDNEEKMRAYHRKWYKKHKKEKAKYRREHREEISTYGKQYYAEHSEEARQYREDHKKYTSRKRKNERKKRIYKQQGDFFKERLEELGENPLWLTEQLGVTRQSVYSYLRGIYLPRSIILGRLYKTLKIKKKDLEDMLEES